MIPAAFEYDLATSVEHAIELLGRGDDAKLIAGGHSLIPAMRLRIARPERLIDIGRLENLRYVREQGDWLAIGALTRHAEVLRDPLVGRHCAVLASATAVVADPQVRNRGTIGGAAAHGHSASDQVTVLTALDAEFVAQGPAGERTIAADEFFRGWFTTALSPQELLTEIRVPKTAHGVYLKASRLTHDWATVGVAAVRVDGRVQVALTNMASTPLRARGVEAALADGGSRPEAAQRASEDASPASDQAGSAEYRGHLARVLTRRALEQLG
jgi:aerobic carbon-monoxide dehydrogenase medium subunit